MTEEHPQGLAAHVPAAADYAGSYHGSLTTPAGLPERHPSRPASASRTAGADLLGKQIELGGVSYEVIGVAGGGFDLGQLGEFDVPPLAYLSLEIAPNADPATAFVNAFRVAARLRDGATLEQVRERLDRSALVYLERFPRAMPEGFTFGAEPFDDYVVNGGTRRALWILAGAVPCVLLIACANTANLFMVRAGSRGREMAVRAAVRAGRGRLIGQLLTESVLLFLAAGRLGLGLGMVGIRALLAVSSSGLPRVGEGGALVVLDWRMLIRIFQRVSDTSEPAVSPRVP